MIRTTFFISLLSVVLLAPTVINNTYAETEHSMDEIIAMITPYITINKDKTISFDRINAETNDIPRHVIEQAKVIIDEQNRLIRGEISTVRSLDVYFEDIREGRTSDKITKHGCNWAAQTQPPPRLSYLTYQNTLSSSQAWLTALGYHNVAPYALHPNAWDNPAIAERDFQKSVSAHGCQPGVFRAEAYLYQDNVYGHSSPEPNPEYLDTSYTWPVWYWPGYVVSWHATH